MSTDSDPMSNLIGGIVLRTSLGLLAIDPAPPIISVDAKGKSSVGLLPEDDHDD